MNIINLNKISARMNEFWQTPCAMAFIVTDNPQTSALVVCSHIVEAPVLPAALEVPEEQRDTWEAIGKPSITSTIQFASAAEFIAPSAASELRSLECALLDVVSRWLTSDKSEDVTKSILDATDAFLAEIDKEDAWAEGLDDDQLEAKAGELFDVDAVRVEAVMHLSGFVDQAKVAIAGLEDLANARLTNGASPGHYHLHLTCAEDKPLCDPLPVHVADQDYLEDLTPVQKAQFTCRICEMLTELPFERIDTLDALESVVSEVSL